MNTFDIFLCLSTAEALTKTAEALDEKDKEINSLQQDIAAIKSAIQGIITQGFHDQNSMNKILIKAVKEIQEAMKDTVALKETLK